MKNRYSLLLTSVISILINTTGGYAQVTFSEVFSSDFGKVAANAVVATPDKHFIIAGESSTNGYALKMDTTGKVIWSKKLVDHVFNCAITTKDSCLILAGGNGITKLNTNGNILWSKTIGTTDPVNIISLQQTYDLGFILTGYTKRNILPSSNIFIAKLDANGLIQWTKTLMIGDGINQGISIKQAADSSYYAMGNFKNTSNLSAQVFLFKLASSGTILWEKTYTLDQISAGDFEITNTGLLLYAFTHNPLIIKTDFLGNIQWCKLYNFSAYETQGRVSISNKIHSSPEGGFVFTSVNCQRSAIIKADDLGNVIWSRNLRLIAVEAIPTKDNGYLIVGNGRDCDAVFMRNNVVATGNEIGIIKTDHLGNSTQLTKCVEQSSLSSVDSSISSTVTPFTLITTTANSATITPVISDLAIKSRFSCINPGHGTIAANNLKNTISISPNPFSTSASILSTIPFKNAQLIIYNAIGQQMKQIDNVSGTFIHLERGNLPNGVYFIQITSSSTNKMDAIITAKLVITD